MHDRLTKLGVSLSMLRDALIKTDSLLPPAKKKKKFNLMLELCTPLLPSNMYVVDNVNQPQLADINLDTILSRINEYTNNQGEGECN